MLLIHPDLFEDNVKGGKINTFEIARLLLSFKFSFVLLMAPCPISCCTVRLGALCLSSDVRSNLKVISPVWPDIPLLCSLADG